MDQELKEQEVHDGRPKDATPESRMRPCEGSIGEGEDGDDEEEDGDPNQTAVDVAVNVRSLVPKDWSEFQNKCLLSQDHKICKGRCQKK